MTLIRYWIFLVGTLFMILFEKVNGVLRQLYYNWKCTKKNVFLYIIFLTQFQAASLVDQNNFV